MNNNTKAYDYVTINDKHGNCYRGYCYNGMREGLGLYTSGNGDSYSGEWHLDKKHGFGEYIYGETWERYRGEWIDDEYCGEGTYYWSPRKKLLGLGKIV